MKKLTLVFSSLVLVFGIGSSNVFACGGEASGKHIGSVMKISDSTFTIRDAETNSPITFAADASVMASVKQATGRVMVNYEENSEGGLTATNVSF